MGIGRRAGVANRQIKSFIGQVNKAVGQFKLDANVGKQLQKRRNAGCQVLSSQCDRRGQADQAARRADQVSRRAVALANAAKCWLHAGNQLLAGVGQANRAGRAAHQQDASGALQFADAHAGRGFGQAQPAGSFGKAAGCGKHCQQVQIGHKRGQLVR